MKQKTSWIAIAGLLVLSLSYYSFFYYSGPMDLVPSFPNSANPNEVRFSITNLPQLYGDDADTLIFLNHGDGSYFMGNVQQLANHKHQYAHNADGYKAFAEMVALYDDRKKPPERTAAITIPTQSSGSLTSTAPTALGTNKVALGRTTNPVPGDPVTYIITYEHPGSSCAANLSGEIYFTYDAVAFDPISDALDIDNFYSGTPQNMQSGTGYAIKKIPFTGLGLNEQRSFFIRLHTRSTVATGAIGVPTNVQLLFNEGCGDSLLRFTDTIAGEMIAAGHDPNFKTVLNTDMCTADSITWRIDFQNEGNALVDSVVVADWIDTLVEYRSVRVVSSKFPVSKTIFHQDAREVRVVMPGIRLRGLGERAVSVDSTRGFVVLRAKIKDRVNCNAIANCARIFFKCNPPVTTKLALAEFPCSDTLCVPCITSKDTLIGPINFSPSPAGDSLLTPLTLGPGLYNTLAPISTNPGWKFKWYPAADLDDPFVLFPRLLKPVRRTYTLVASNSNLQNGLCQRVIVRVSARPSTALNLSSNWVATSGCPTGPPIWALTATASGPPANLVWQDCSSGKDSWTSSVNLNGGQTVYVAVWDTLTEDYAEQWVNLPYNCPPPTCPVSNGVWIALAVIALAAFIFRFLSRNN